jgi:hypothetical protein
MPYQGGECDSGPPPGDPEHGLAPSICVELPPDALVGSALLGAGRFHRVPFPHTADSPTAPVAIRDEETIEQAWHLVRRVLPWKIAISALESPLRAHDRLSDTSGFARYFLEGESFEEEVFPTRDAGLTSQRGRLSDAQKRTPRPRSILGTLRTTAGTACWVSSKSVTRPTVATTYARKCEPVSALGSRPNSETGAPTSSARHIPADGTNTTQ